MEDSPAAHENFLVSARGHNHRVVWGAVSIWLVTINLVAILTFRDDKRRAVAGTRRIRERTLLTLAWLGGSPGALFARRHYRHKTRKQPFSTWLLLIPFVQCGALVGFCGPF